MNKDLNHYSKKITVLRGFGPDMFCVCQGKSFYGSGLNEKYKEFTDYQDAVLYFNKLTN